MHGIMLQKYGVPTRIKQRFAMRVCLRQWDLTQDELLSASGLTLRQEDSLQECVTCIQ